MVNLRWAFALASVVCACLFACGGCGGGGDNSDNSTLATVTPTAGVPTPQATATASIGNVTAWAIGTGIEASIIVRSRDSGATWSVVRRAPESLAGIEFVDRNTGWAVGFGEILHTTDGGDTWISQRLNVRDPSILGLLVAVTFVTPTQGVIVGGRPGGVPPAPPTGPVLILRTTDAGLHWEEADIAPSGNVALLQSALGFVCFTSSGSGLSCGDGFAGGVCLLSSDGGATWTDVSTRILGRNGACVGTSAFWVLGGGRLLSHSDDAGATFVDMSGNLPTAIVGELLGVTFITESTGWVAGTDSQGHPLILHTTDTGATWTRQAVPDLQAGVFVLSFFGDTGVAVGSATAGNPDGVALRTSDGGTAWTSGAVPSDLTMFSAVDGLSSVPTTP